MPKRYSDALDADILWRYMPLSKFIDILVTSSISFCRPDIFEDVYEGSHTDFIQAVLDILNDEDAGYELIDSFKENAVKSYEEVKYKSHILCLHANQVESAAMWKLYGNQQDTIAIKTTVKSLKASLNPAVINQKLEFGLVDYSTNLASLRSYYDKNRAPKEAIKIHVLNFLFSKRSSFEHEKEYRVLALPEEPIFHHTAAGHDLSFIKHNSPAVIKVPCKPETLIEEIVIAPDASKWFVNMVKELVNQLGLNLKISQSQLYTIQQN